MKLFWKEKVDVQALKKKTLSAVDEDSAFEQFVNRYCVTPVVNVTPAWVKPNTVSLLNHTVGWLQLLLAFAAVHVDQTQEEYESGVMGPGRALESARFQAFMLRIAVSIFVFIMLVLDCVDGAHARRTKQASKLGEVMDHALDAGNVPLLAVAMLVMVVADKYTIVISLLGCGTVFNSQLVVYRHYHKMIKPPTNGPEAQFMVVVSGLMLSTMFFLVGRHQSAISTFVIGVCFFGNLLQFNNTFYFWRYLDSKTMKDHLVFCVHVLLLSAIFLAGRISEFTYIISCILTQLRLSGVYVTLTVANSQRLQGNSKEPVIQSAFTSSYSGFDWQLLLWVVLYYFVPSAVAAIGPHAETFALIVFGAHISAVCILDIHACLPYLLPDSLKGKPMIELFF